MDSTCRIHGVNKKTHTKSASENPQGRAQLGDLGADGA